MYNPYVSGPWDCWYSGLKKDLWIEYKWYPTADIIKPHLPELSGHQRDWGNARLDEGRNLAVIVGTPKGGVLYTHGEWNHPTPPKIFREKLTTRKDLALWIEGITCLGLDV